MTTAEIPVPTVECRRCEMEVPAGNYCGLCGCDPGADPHESLLWQRRGAFGAAPAESVLRPYLASSLFPQLPSRSRRPFRVILILGAAGLVVAGLLRMPALGITIGALGLPLLFGLYLRASGADRDVPRASLVIAGVLGAALGSAWVLVSGHVIASNFGVPMSVGLALHHLVREGFVVPAVGIVVMTIPAVVIRLLRPGSRESLDGFMIGAFAALAFSAAATLTRLAPQVATGLINHSRPVKGLVIEGILCGMTIPVSAAAAGGMVGVALWFRRPAGGHGRVRTVLWLLAAAGMLMHAAVGVTDIVGLPQLAMVVTHLAVTVVELLALRVALQLALLHEAHDPVQEDQPLLCPHCEHVVPDMPFCPACGAATRASSRESRRERRGVQRPRRLVGGADPPDGQAAPADAFPGYALPGVAYATTAVRRPRVGWLLGRWGIVILTVAVALGAAALVLTPRIAHFMCPPDCGRPPTGTPVTGLPRFAAPDGRFSVAYPAAGSAYTVTTEDRGVTARFTGGDGGVMQLFSEPANGRSARDVVERVLRDAYPDAKVDYEIPNAMVGYQPGYGVVADAWPQSTSATFTRVRIVVTSAVRNDVALIAFAAGPYRAFGPDFGPGPPSGANLQLAQDMGKYVNSFQWQGDPPR